MSWEEERVVQGDWTVACEGNRYQLDSRHEALSLVRRKVIVRTQRNGRVQLVYQGKPLQWRVLPAGVVRKAPPSKKSKAAVAATPKRVERKPAKTHPWRRDGVGVGGAYWQRIRAQGQPGKASREKQSTRGHSLLSYDGDISKEF